MKNAAKLNKLATAFYEAAKTEVWAEDPKICLPDDADMAVTSTGIRLGSLDYTILETTWDEMLSYLSDLPPAERRTELEMVKKSIREAVAVLKKYCERT